MRFGITIDGGWANSGASFASPYGLSFLFVDGACRYYVSRDYMAGIRTGSLSTAQSQELATAMSWSEIDTWSSVQETASCLDGATTTLWKPGASAECTCGQCAPGPFQAAMATTFARVTPWFDMLVGQGAELDTSVSAVASEFGSADSEPPWPLDRAMVDIEFLIQDISHGQVISQAALFDNPTDSAALRALRAQSMPSSGRLLTVQEAGTAYQLVLRDELPETVRTAIQDLLSGHAR